MSENLAYVLAKVQFGEITESKFNEAVDAVQEELRKIYPIKNDNDKVITFQLDIPSQSSEGHQFTQTYQKILNISSANKDWGIRITRDNIVIQTKKYEGFDKFKSRIEYLIEVLSEKFGIYHTSFIGFRFINKYELDETTHFSRIYRRNEFLQPDLKLDGFLLAGSNHQARYQVGEYLININSGVAIDGLKLTAELGDLPADIGIQPGEVLQGVWAHLDIDAVYHRVEGMDEYDLEDVINRFKDLRKLANQVYSEITYAESST